MCSGREEDIILCTIRKTRLHVVSGAFSISTQLLSIDIDVISFQLVEHDHAFGTLDALATIVLAPDWGLSWRKSAGGGFDVGDLAVIANHIFIGLSAVVGDPEGRADTTAWRALWQVCGDVEVRYSFVGSAVPQLSVNDQKEQEVHAYLYLVVKTTRFSIVTLLMSF